MILDYGESGWRSFILYQPFVMQDLIFLEQKGHPFVSLTSYAVNPGINIVIMLLIIIGGIGFFDMGRHLSS
mgnify:CR=1 FL=1